MLIITQEMFNKVIENLRNKDNDIEENIRKGYRFENNFKYRLSEDGNSVFISGYNRNDKDIIIPSQIEGLPVKMIDHNAFRYKELNSTAIPDGVTEFKCSAFENCGISSVNIPDGVIKIMPYSFWGNDLSNVIIPNSVENIYFESFSNNSSTSVTL
jgi:hypothetical protein